MAGGSLRGVSIDCCQRTHIEPAREEPSPHDSDLRDELGSWPAIAPAASGVAVAPYVIEDAAAAGKRSVKTHTARGHMHLDPSCLFPCGDLPHMAFY